MEIIIFILKAITGVAASLFVAFLIFFVRARVLASERYVAFANSIVVSIEQLIREILKGRIVIAPTCVSNSNAHSVWVGSDDRLHELFFELDDLFKDVLVHLDSTGSNVGKVTIPHGEAKKLVIRLEGIRTQIRTHLMNITVLNFSGICIINEETFVTIRRF